jgi:membrane protein implicated in regulation of membrane protease activity
MDVWIVWLLLAAVLGVAELFTLSAALGLLGGAAVVTAGAAALGAPVTAIWLVRPVVLRHLHAPPAQRFGVDALVGRSAQVVREISSNGGTVRIDGEEWTARPCDPHDPAYVIPAGATVSVVAIRGATALVYPQE